MAIPVTCSACGANLKTSEDLIGKKAKCPKCSNLLFIKGLNIEVEPTEEATVYKVQSAPEPNAQPIPINPQPSQTSSESPVFTFDRDTSYSERLKARPFSSAKGESIIKTREDIIKLVTGSGLGCLTLSTFLSWINFGVFNIRGVQSPVGLAMLTITIIVAVIYAAALTDRRWSRVGMMITQGWGTIAALWIMALLLVFFYELLKSDPKGAAILAILILGIGPGNGLYLGLFGALLIAGALGYLLIQECKKTGDFHPYIISQSVSVAIAILLIIITYVGSFNVLAPKNEGDQKITRKDIGIPLFNFTEDKADDQNKTPPAAPKVLPRLKQPKDYYYAEWLEPGLFMEPREFERNWGNSYTLTLCFVIYTEPDIPIKNLYGHLAIIKDGRVLYETFIEDENDVSFTDRTVVLLDITYNDNDPIHRELRFTDLSELKPVFTIQKVDLADGTVKTFD